MSSLPRLPLVLSVGAVVVRARIIAGKNQRHRGTISGRQGVSIEIELTVFNDEDSGRPSRIDDRIGGEHLVAALEKLLPYRHYLRSTGLKSRITGCWPPPNMHCHAWFLADNSVTAGAANWKGTVVLTCVRVQHSRLIRTRSNATAIAGSDGKP